MGILATIFDIETTGLDDKAIPTEIGFVFGEYNDTPCGFEFKPIAMHSFLIDDGKVDPKDREDSDLITGITEHYTEEFGGSLEDVVKYMVTYIAQSEFVCGHNILDFDVPFLQRSCPTTFDGTKILDTLTDIRYEKNQRRSLDSLAMHYRILNLFPHRALSDAITTALVLEHMQLHVLMEVIDTPILHIAARVSFDDKDKAKSRGYMWDGSKKIWHRNIRQYYFREEIAECLKEGFTVYEI